MNGLCKLANRYKDGGQTSGVISPLHGKDGLPAIPRPYERDIFLFDTRIAGTRHIEGIEDLAPHLNVDDKLEFFREPDSQYDDKAIAIRNVDGVKIGYVPQADNVIFARLMDAGKLLFVKITANEMRGSWLRIDIKVFLHE